MKGQWRPWRDATVATAVLGASIVVGSEGLRHFDPALRGYAVALVVAFFALVQRTSSLWRRAQAAVFLHALCQALRSPREWGTFVRVAVTRLGTQRFVARRSSGRWLAHLALSWGTLVAFAVTVPLVFGWVHFEAWGPRHYRPYAWGVGLVPFAVDSVLGWLVFHILHLCSIAVLVGCAYFVWQRVRSRGEWSSRHSFHLGPLLALAVVAATGLALPAAARSGDAYLFRLAQLTHEVAVILFVVSLPFGKLAHIVLRPLHVGVQVLRGTSREHGHCAGCSRELAPAAQLQLVREMVERQRVGAPAVLAFCPACRRRFLALSHSRLVHGGFQPPAVPSFRPVAREAA